jgi:acyl-CoA thioesterase-1
MKFIIIGVLMAAIAGCGERNRLSPLPVDATVLCFGDSLTYGTGAEHGRSYPEELARLINRPVVNAGIPGETSGEALNRLQGELDMTRPKLLILCSGANDILRRMDLNRAAANVREMVMLAKGRGIEVVLVGVPHWGLGLQPTPFYRAIADELNVPLENKILAKVLAKDSLRADQVHPNAAGYRKIAEAVASLLARNGGV